MLDGINYYPKKRKKAFKKKLFWAFLFFLILGAIWYYFQGAISKEKESKSIIISIPPNIEYSENIIIDNSEDAIAPDLTQEETENLDEVISTYEASTQN